ncbi:MAG: fumarylacetoacetate hydrolase family protein [Bifidobacteriaceae bacterium]|jgi:2-keto-4-pentenoate hydratase/2-oxohepta-3-ene-1,7-dioic acid hydratase in catechol pathway|nr:fumarylacetoacetate hydrolase family protein [Bifidobacteriaceae bacterium]
MRIARFTVDDTPSYGIVLGEEGEEHVQQVSGDPLYTKVAATGKAFPLEDVRLLAPVIPRSKVVGIGLNYATDQAGRDKLAAAEPLVFLKPNTSVVGPGDPVVIPSWAPAITFEAELAVIISRICKDVPANRADDVVLGYTVANDISAGSASDPGVNLLKAKAFDTACPLGPWIETELPKLGGDGLAVRSWVDGREAQDGSTAQMARGVPELVAYVSSLFTLLPGDVIITGTPAGNGRVDPAQRVTCEVEGIGTLTNPIVRR